MSSSQYSPRVVHSLFRDNFNKRVIGMVVGTFTYCLVVLRSVHGALESGPGSVVPTLSVTVAVVFGVTVVLAIVGFIDHNAHRMDVSEILQTVTDETRERVMEAWSEPDEDRPEIEPPPSGEPSTVVLSDTDGWVQQLDASRLLAALPEGATMVMEVNPGLYTVRGTPLGRIWPPVDDADALAEEVRAAVVTGPSRTLTQDPDYGLRQMVDVGLRALSPGVNDPTTAQDAVFHVAATLSLMLTRTPPSPERRGDRGQRVVLRIRKPTDLVDLAFDELRRSAAALPTVASYLLAAIDRVLSAVPDDADPTVRVALARQARLVVAECEQADVPEWDLEPLRRRLGELGR
jgi:uncharacterized membrane protein